MDATSGDDGSIARRPPSRAFGLMLAGLCALLGVYPLWNGFMPRWWALVLGALLAVAALLRPATLIPLTRLWMRLGTAFHRVVNPLVLGFIFFGVVAPVAIVARARGRDCLRLKIDPHARSYWVERSELGPPSSSMQRQF